MANDTQNVQSTIDSASKGVETAANAGSATLAAFAHFLNSRSYMEENAKILSDFLKKGGQLRCMTLDASSVNGMCKMLDQMGVKYVSCKIESGDKSRCAILYAMGQENMVKHVRELYLAANHKIFQVSKETISQLSRDGEIRSYGGLSYAEMFSLKKRGVENEMMFASEKNRDGTYTMYVRAEDRKKWDVLRAGVEQEKQGTGEKVYEQQNQERKKHEKVIGHVAANPDTSIFIGNSSGTKVLYVNKEGLYFENCGPHGKREFVSRDSDEFERMLCQYVDQIRNPRMIWGAKADELGKDLRADIVYDRTENVMTMDEALKKFGFGNIREVTEEKLKEKMQESPEKTKDQNTIEAYYKLQRAVDLYHTKQESVSKVYVSGPEKEAFEAEQQARTEFEKCINSGDVQLGQLAQQYIDGNISRDDIQQFAKEHEGDIRRNIQWREPYDIPEYLDSNGDHILDEYQEEEFAHDREDVEEGINID